MNRNEIIDEIDKRFFEVISVKSDTGWMIICPQTKVHFFKALHARDAALIKAIAEAVKGQKKRGTGAHTEAVAIINSFGEDK